MQCALCHTDLSSDAAYCPRCGARQAGVSEFVDYQYSAFISYRHRERDTEIAKRVQAAIEEFTLPPDIAQTYGAQRFARVFRDQDELPATDSLPDTIREALARSRALIVVCTPETPKSRWVASEVETFAQLHGRRNIYLVLADGTSAESIPELLRTRAVIGPDGAISEQPAEPLAADMRPSAAKRFKREMLRLIAGLSGCSLDDLAQRERSRRRKRTLRAGAVAAAVIALVAGFAIFALSNSREAKIAESQRLAAESRELYAQGDRLGAIERALEALPASSTDMSRPLVPEAQEALEQALQIADDGLIWRPSFKITTEGALGPYAVDFENGRIAFLEVGNCVSVYDFRLGIHLGDAPLPSAESASSLITGLLDSDEEKRRFIEGAENEDMDSSGWNLTMRGDCLIISECSGSGYFACYDVEEGKLKWHRAGLPIYGAAFSPTGDKLAVAIKIGTAIAVSELDAETGEMERFVSFEVEDAPSWPKRFPIVWDNDDVVWVGAGSIVEKIDLLNESCTGFTFDGNWTAGSLSLADGVVAVAFYEPLEEKTLFDKSFGGNAQFAAFDAASCRQLWNVPTSWMPRVIEGGAGAVIVGGAPQLFFWQDDPATIFASSSGTLYEINRFTGEVVYSHTFAARICSLSVLSLPESLSPHCVVVCADGGVFSVAPHAASMEEIIEMPNVVPCWIRDSANDVVAGGRVHALAARALENEKELYVYTTSAALAGLPEEMRPQTLDDLVALARVVLEWAA